MIPRAVAALARTFALAAIAALLLSSLPALAQSLSATEHSVWKQKLISIVPNSIEGARTVQAFLALDPEGSSAVLKEAWSEIPSAESRLYLLNTMQEHPRVLDLLDLGATDPSLYVQNRAFQVLVLYSFQNFAEDFSAYESWRQKQANRSIEDTIRESCRDFIHSIAGLDDASKFQRMAIMQQVAYNMAGAPHSLLRRKAMLESGLPDALALWIRQQNIASTAFALLRNLRMDEAYLRRVVVPLTDPGVDVAVRRQAFGVLAAPDNLWATNLLLKRFVEEYPDPEAESMGYSLVQLGDPHILPTLIAMLEADKSADGERVLGNILNVMTGNNNGAAHDGVWWRGWWKKNTGRFPPDVRSLPFPQVTLRPRAVTPGGIRAPEQRQIAGDFKRTYWLVSPLNAAHAAGGAGAGGIAPPPAPPAAALANHEAGGAQGSGRLRDETPGLLVVLPPDGNGANAALFWQEMEQKALNNHYYVAVATAPRWSDTQTATWLTSETVKQVKEAKFTTEKFVTEIVQDVLASHPIRPDRIFLHGAAESGPLVYQCSLEVTTPFKGFFILASAFKSVNLPPLSRAKGRRYVIEHSPDDKTAPYLMAAAAQKLLTEQGAAAKLLAYKGSHGYAFTDPSVDPISEALAWLEGPPK